MIKDIYNILPTDGNYLLLLETSDEIIYILQQIRMVLGTKPGEVLGSPLFGINLELYLFNLSYNTNEIKKKVQEAIIRNIYYDTKKYALSVDVKFGKEKTAASDYALIDISINERRCMGVIVTL